MEYWIQKIDDMVWGPWILVILMGTGLLLMVRMDFLPVRRLGFALRCIFESRTKQQEKSKESIPDNHSSARKVSPFASLTTELAATIGIGNIVGVATAMVLGGPGALFWMLIGSVVGLATKLVESALSVKYRGKNEKGEWVGGPMCTLNKIFVGKLGTFLGAAYALFAVMASFGMGNMVQANSIAQAMHITFQVPVALGGLILTLVTILVVIGGIGKIAKVTTFLVPFMGIFYLAGALGVIGSHLDRLPGGIGVILISAFAPKAACGGLLGHITGQLTMMQSMRYGISRGVFSNEAGLGAAGITAAAADTKDYIRQGYISMTGVFFDTFVICLITGLAIMCSGLLGAYNTTGELLNGAELAIAVFEATYGEWGARFVCVSMILFAFATIVAWAYQGEKAFEYLLGTIRYNIWYRFVYALVVFLGAVCSLEVVWNFSDICNGLMAVPNLICVLIMGILPNGICEEIKRYSNTMS